MRREVTVGDVAVAAKVSKATAARALGDYGAVSDELRERVQTAAARLGYRPNELARTMSTGRSYIIGMIVGDIQNPFFARATRGAADVIAAAGYDLILSNSDERSDAEQKAIGVQLAKQVDGLLVAPASSVDSTSLSTVTAAGRGLVLFDRTVNDLRVDAVIAANRSGALRLTRLLTKAGHRRIAFLSTLQHDRAYRTGDLLLSSSVADRVAGFEKATAEAGIHDEAIVRLGAPRDEVERVATELLSGPDPVTAIVASDSLVALGAYRAAQQQGLRIPDDLSLVTFDDADWTTLAPPGITVMAQPIHEIGAEAARILLRRLAGDRSEPALRVLDQSLIPRGSVAPPPGR